MQCVSKLEQRLTDASAKEKLNDIAQLYELCESADLRTVAAALKAVANVLYHHRSILNSCPVDGEEDRGDLDENNQELTNWLRQHGEVFHATLTQLALSKEPRARVCATRLLLTACQQETDEIRSLVGSRTVRLLPSPPEQRIHDFLSELLLAQPWRPDAIQCIMNEFVKLFIDVRHYIFTHLRVCLEAVRKATWDDDDDDIVAAQRPKRRKQQSLPFVDSMRSKGITPQDLFDRVFEILREAPEPPQNRSGNGALSVSEPIQDEDDADGGKVFMRSGRPQSFFLREYPKLFQDVWLQLLSLPASVNQYKPVLQFLPTSVMPHLGQPLLLADFYLRAFHGKSAEISVLSLSGLFVLLTKHSLGDPETLSSSAGEFYAQLYSLFNLETFKLQKRARFQRLAAASLCSGLMPARFAAAFAKKNIHLAVAISDPGIVMWLLAIAYSLIQRHHSHCQYLLHKPVKDGESSHSRVATDPFDGSASLSSVLEQLSGSSLWELQLLQRHHLQAIRVIAQLFTKPFFKPTSRKLDPELYLGQSTSTLYDQTLRGGERQMTKLKAIGKTCPVAFQAQDDALAGRVVGWAAALSTSQRQIGTGM